MYANWAGLIVNTNFHLGEGSLSMRSRVRLDLARPQSCIIARIGPKTMNCVEPAGRALEQQKPAKHKGNAQRPRIPWDTPSKPLCAAWGTATTTVGRGAQGAKGGQGGGAKGGRAGWAKRGAWGGTSNFEITSTTAFRNTSNIDWYINEMKWI